MLILFSLPISFSSLSFPSSSGNQSYLETHCICIHPSLFSKPKTHAGKGGGYRRVTGVLVSGAFIFILADTHSRQLLRIFNGRNKGTKISCLVSCFVIFCKHGVLYEGVFLFVCVKECLIMYVQVVLKATSHVKPKNNDSQTTPYLGK